ncbi:helix-turn-helix transcriptional regulator [Nocardiopsis dassonvillei]
MTSETVSDIVAQRVRQLRKSQGMKATDLAEKCRELGMPHLTAATISNIETGRRDKDGRRRRNIDVDELLVLAHALNVAPVHLMVPTEGDDTPYPVLPSLQVPRKLARWFIRGFESLPGQNWRRWLVEAPETEAIEREHDTFTIRVPKKGTDNAGR